LRDKEKIELIRQIETRSTLIVVIQTISERSKKKKISTRKNKTASYGHVKKTGKNSQGNVESKKDCNVADDFVGECQIPTDVIHNPKRAFPHDSNVQFRTQTKQIY